MDKRGLQNFGDMFALWYPRHLYFKHIVAYKIWFINNIHHMCHSTLGLLKSYIYILKTSIHIPILLLLFIRNKPVLLWAEITNELKISEVFITNICPYQNGGSWNNYYVSRQQHYRWMWISITTDYSNSFYSSQTTTASGKHNTTTCDQTGDISESTFSNQGTNLKTIKNANAEGKPQDLCV